MKSKMLSVVLALALALAACGGGAEETTTITAEDTTSTAEGSPTTEGSPTSTTASSTTSTTTATTSTEAGPPEASGDLAVLQSAMAQTVESAPSRVEGVIRMVGLADAPVPEVEIPFSVVTDPATGDSSMVMDLGAMAAMSDEEMPSEMADLMGSMEVREIGDTVYMKFPFFTAFLGAETEWVSMPADQSDMADDMAPSTPSDPGAFLDSFQDAEGEVEVIGPEEIRGISTTHYRIMIGEQWAETLTDEEMSDLEEQGFSPDAEFPLELWVDDDGLVHRMSIVAEASQIEDTEGAFESMTMTFDFFDFGQSVTIEPPPADQVTDVEEMMGGFGTVAP